MFRKPREPLLFELHDDIFRLPLSELMIAHAAWREQVDRLRSAVDQFAFEPHEESPVERYDHHRALHRYVR